MGGIAFHGTSTLLILVYDQAAACSAIAADGSKSCGIFRHVDNFWFRVNGFKKLSSHSSFRSIGQRWFSGGDGRDGGFAEAGHSYDQGYYNDGNPDIGKCLRIRDGFRFE